MLKPTKNPFRQPTRLHAERLEDRLLMNADDTLAVLGDAGADEVVQTPAGLSADAPVAAIESVLPPRFGSEEAFRSWMRELAEMQYGHLFGEENYGYWNGGYLCGDFDSSLLRTFPMNDAVTEEFSFASTGATNVQVAGVDEADLVESDGERLFVLRDDQLLIFNANGEDPLELAARVQLDAPASRMFLSGDRLAIVSESNEGNYLHSSGSIRLANSLYWQSPTPTTTTVTVLDVTDPSAPTQVQQTEIDGRVVDLRAVDGQLRIVTMDQIRLPRLEVSKQHPTDSGDKQGYRDSQGVNAAVDFATLDYAYVRAHESGVYESREDFFARLDSLPIAELLPGYRTLDVHGEVTSEGVLAGAAEVLRSASSSASSYLSNHNTVAVTTLDMHADLPGPIDSEVFLSSASIEVYATHGSIYLFSAHTSPPAQGGPIVGGWSLNHENRTRIWKFDADASTGNVDLDAAGEVDGRLLNQFAADEYEGVLRVVMTGVGGSWNGGQAVYTLQQAGDDLKVIGAIEGIAPRENLHSVTFRGDEVHFVTYRKVDPLFTVDLSDPTKPIITGELKIPGYSERLIPINEGHLLGIGRGADGGWFAEMQLSIFDTTDPTSPERIHLESIVGGRSTTAEATGNRWRNGDGDHHALAFYADKAILALPLETESAKRHAGETLFDPGEGGLLLYRVDVETGFEIVAIIEHDDPIRRTVRVGDRLYAISNAAVTSHELGDLSETFDSIDLDDAGEYTEVVDYISPATTMRMVADFQSAGGPNPSTPRNEAFATREFGMSSPIDGYHDLLLLATNQIRSGRELQENVDTIFGDESDDSDLLDDEPFTPLVTSYL